MFVQLRIKRNLPANTVSSSTFPLHCLQVLAAPRQHTKSVFFNIYPLCYSVLDPVRGEWNEAGFETITHQFLPLWVPASHK